MTEYQDTNGHLSNGVANGYIDEPCDLEESVLSLLSQSQSSDFVSSLHHNYQKSAKLFINKKFDQSLRLVETFIDESVKLYDQNRIETKLFINIWSLYFNLVDIILNKSVKQLSNEEFNKLNEHFLDPDYMFDKVFHSHKVCPPKLIVLLLLIKLNNSETNLIKLRAKVDTYLVNTSSVFNPLVNDEEYKDFQELLEIYHVHLMARLGAFEEGEYLIRDNPHLAEVSEELVKRLHQRKIDLEEEEKLKKEQLQKKEQQLALAQQKKEQKLKEQRLLKEKKRREKEAVVAKKDTELGSKSSQKELTILEIIKERLLKLQVHKVPALAIIFAVISLLTLSKTYSLIRLNRRLKEQIEQFWGRALSTLKMAFQVTYV